MAIPTRVADRLSAGLKRYRPIIEAAKARDVNEADTVVIVVDLLSDMFGFDKFNEITGELCIKGTYCDRAIRLDDKIRMIVEVKSISSELRDAHIKQAVDYATNKGIEWVALTNGWQWKVYRVLFTQPIGQEQALDIDLLTMNPKSTNHLESLYLLTRESMVRSGLDAHYGHLQVLNKYMVAAMLLSDPMTQLLRRELQRVSPDIRIQIENLKEILVDQVVKREVIEGEKFDLAQKKVQKSAGKSLKVIKKEKEKSPIPNPVTLDDIAVSPPQEDLPKND